MILQFVATAFDFSELLGLDGGNDAKAREVQVRGASLLTLTTLLFIGKLIAIHGDKVHIKYKSDKEHFQLFWLIAHKLCKRAKANDLKFSQFNSAAIKKVEDAIETHLSGLKVTIAELDPSFFPQAEEEGESHQGKAQSVSTGGGPASSVGDPEFAW